jgi:hypothetical protein
MVMIVKRGNQLQRILKRITEFDAQEMTDPVAPAGSITWCFCAFQVQQAKLKHE